jgi:hypothetical protein
MPSSGYRQAAAATASRRQSRDGRAASRRVPPVGIDTGAGTGATGPAPWPGARARRAPAGRPRGPYVRAGQVCGEGTELISGPRREGGAYPFLEFGLGQPAVDEVTLQQRHHLVPFAVGGADGLAGLLCDGVAHSGLRCGMPDSGSQAPWVRGAGPVASAAHRASCPQAWLRYPIDLLLEDLPFIEKYYSARRPSSGPAVGWRSSAPLGACQNLIFCARLAWSGAVHGQDRPARRRCGVADKERDDIGDPCGHGRSAIVSAGNRARS